MEVDGTSPCVGTANDVTASRSRVQGAQPSSRSVSPSDLQVNRLGACFCSASPMQAKSGPSRRLQGRRVATRQAVSGIRGQAKATLQDQHIVRVRGEAEPHVAQRRVLDYICAMRLQQVAPSNGGMRCWGARQGFPAGAHAKERSLTSWRYPGARRTQAATSLGEMQRLGRGAV